MRTDRKADDVKDGGGTVPRRASRLALPTAISKALDQHRALISALAFFVFMMVVFTIASPEVWLNTQSYGAVFVSLPLYIFLVVPLVFVVVSGEIDVSFASVVGVSALVFAQFVLLGFNPWLCVILAILAGVLAGILNGFLVAYVGLSSLVVTLGMYFLWRGFIQVITNGSGAPLQSLVGTRFRALLVGDLGVLSAQMLWAIAFAVVGMALFSLHKFGAYARFVGDNPGAAREMGINVRLVKLIGFAYVGLASGIVGVLAVLINNNFYPTVGDGYLLVVLAALFVGGTPIVGGIGTVAGAVVGAFTVGFIESGIIAAGLTGFWTQFIYGVVIVVSLLTHRIYAPQRER
jgi:simple sugar transport system permease protein